VVLDIHRGNTLAAGCSQTIESPTVEVGWKAEGGVMKLASIESALLVASLMMLALVVVWGVKILAS
jgi:hypothetical protein